MTRLFKSLWLIAFVFFSFYFLSTYSQLPDTFATHFDLSGTPNGWSSKTSFLYLFFGLTVGINIMLFLLYNLVSHLPDSQLNLPNKSYWFSTPERRLLIYDKIRGIFSLIGSFTNLVFIFCAYIIFQENKVAVPFNIPINLGITIILFLALSMIIALFLITKKISRP